MGKTFKEDYYDDDERGKKMIKKSSKKTRHKVKDYLKHLEIEKLDKDFEIEEIED